MGAMYTTPIMKNRFSQDRFPVALKGLMDERQLSYRQLAYKTKLSAYTNKKNAYEKDKEEYENANILKRQLMREPVNPGVPPEREVNTILKPTQVADLDAMIKAKEVELVTVNNKRRESVALVAADAQGTVRLRGSPRFR